MNTDQAKHYLLSFDEEVFIEWYNELCVDPYGDFRDAKIERNTPENVWNKVRDMQLTPEGFINLCKEPSSDYKEDDEYFYIGSEIFSFNSLEEFLVEDRADYVISQFLEEEEYNREFLEERRK